MVGTVKGSIAFLFFMPTLLAFNLFQIFTLMFWIFSPKAFRAMNRWGANTWWGWCDWWAKKLNGVKIIISGEEIPERENAIVIVNHQEFSDIPVIFTLANIKKRLGDCKWFVKDIIKYVPGVGWGMLFLDCLFVKRNWSADQDYISRVFEKILKNKVPLWLITFAEGTRISPSKVEESKKYAQKQNLPPTDHVLIPRTKGFVATVKGLRDHVDVVYDFTIGYEDGLPTMWQWIKGYVQRVHMHVRRFEIKDLPFDDESLTRWLYKCFQEKDALLDCYYKQGSFPSKAEIRAE